MTCYQAIGATYWQTVRSLLSVGCGYVEIDGVMAAWRGQLDVVDRERIAGWACDEERPGTPVALRILDNGTLIGQVTADKYREDLQAAGLGEGCHAFSLRVPGGLAPEVRHLINVQRVEDGGELPGSPYVLEAAVALVTVMRNALPAPWRGILDIVTRDRIEGWVFHDAAPNTPLALAILDNGEVIARVLANRYREDLENAGMGDGRHGFSVTIPGGLSPLSRHVIQVLGEADGCEMPGSPVTLESASGFDAALEHAVSNAVAAIALPEDRDRALKFLAAQTERLLQDSANAASSREARLVQKQFERRWGKGESPAGEGGSAAPSLRALVIDDLYPSPENGTSSTAILSHMRALQSLGYEVSFIAAEVLSPPESVAASLEALGFVCCRLPHYASVEEIFRRQPESFEVIYLHRVSNASKYLALARRYCPKAAVLYSVGDLHNVRFARQANVEKRPELLAHSRRLRVSECTAASMASAIITHSSVEATWLRQAVTGSNVHVVCWAVAPRPTPRAWSERSGVAFVANFAHAANLDAARYLVEHIMPRVVREDPLIELSLVGSNMPESIKRLAGPGIVTAGFVDDLSDIYDRVRLVVAPLRYGSGIKGQVLESLAAGVPVVMSPMAAEGIPLPEILARAVVADETRMAALIVRLHSNEAESQTLSKAGLAFIAAGYTEASITAGLKAAIEGQRSLGTTAAVAQSGLTRG